MEIKTRRNFFGKIAAMAALVAGAPKLFAQQAPAAGGSNIGSVPAGSPANDASCSPQWR